MQVNILEAKTELSQLVEAAPRGEEVDANAAAKLAATTKPLRK